MPRYTVSARTYVALNGADMADADWGLEFRTSDPEPGGTRLMEIYAQAAGATWRYLGSVSFFPDYSGVLTFGGPEAIGRRFALATIPQGTPLSQLEISSRPTIGQGSYIIEGSYRGDFWNGNRGAHDEIYGLGGDDRLSGGWGNDSLAGGSGNDQLTGGVGFDLLIGDGGRDTLRGGLGNDRYVIDRQDVVIEAAGQGRDHVMADFDYTLAAHVEDLTLTGWQGHAGAGNALNNSIFGNGGANLLRGHDGHDNLIGGAGDDTLIGGAGNDAMRGGAGNDLLRGVDGIDTAIYVGNGAMRVDLSNQSWQFTGQGRDMLLGIENLRSGGGHDRLTGDAGSNILNAGAGNDTLIGGAGHDTLIGGAGADSLIGGAGHDVYWIDHLGDRTVEQAGGGIDRILSVINVDLARPGGVYAHIENVVLGGAGHISGFGNAGANLLMGNGGANVLAGRGGDDRLTGNGGADVFIFGRGDDQDRIMDFQDGVDRLRLQGFADVETLAQARAHATQTGADVVFDFGDGDRLVVQGMSVDALMDDLIIA